MKTNSQTLFFSAALFLVVGGCATTEQNSAGSSKPAKLGDTVESVLAHPDVKKNQPTNYAQPLSTVHEASLRALNFVGCEIKQNRPYYVEGKRPQKMGLFVGSGGETVKVFMLPALANTNETQVWVDTDLSFVGIAGQQGWNKQTIAEMSRILNSTNSAAK